jgi:aspartate/methionine/tyrosine aminotransferase
MPLKKLTDEEILALGEECNLADGHAYRAWNAAEAAIVARAGDTFRRVDRRNRRTLEHDYLKSFFAASKQTLRDDYFKFFLCFTASTAIEVIANYLRTKRLSVALIEPCFDNLHDILARHDVCLTPLPESAMVGEPNVLERALRDISADAIFLVSPNNPTGAQIRKENFLRVLEFCRSQQRILILDETFRFYLPDEDVYDQYQILADAAVDCIIIEDTGKTWPTLELKAPFFSVSSRLAPEIADIYSDFLLHVSPVSVALMTDFLCLPYKHGLGHVRDIIAANRRVLYADICDTFLHPREAPYMSVAWLKITTGLRASEIKKRLADVNVHVLAGNQFFWSDGTHGNSFIRVALSRDPTMFRKASARIRKACLC